MGFTCHWINKNWELKKACLGVEKIFGHHTAVNLGIAFGNTIPYSNYERIMCVVTDNAANIRSAINKETEFDGYPCTAHTIQLCEYL
jgi:hypothetical protein